ncbi:hypothetical protein [Bacillus sp. Marseille-Q1617]|nr:hypothetical protein [Bacillus sp. Marseille-Q1617]
MTDWETAYLAGIIDGEGSITLPASMKMNIGDLVFLLRRLIGNFSSIFKT